jgi:hypothetical protein
LSHQSSTVFIEDIFMLTPIGIQHAY